MSDDDAPLTRRAEARVGTQLKGKWTIDKLLGEGGMAVVYAATHRNKKRVAIKMLHPELSVDPDIRSRFLREGYVANTVDHPGAVMVDDEDVAEDGAAFIVMELLQGETVQARMDRKGGRLPVDEVLSIADQLLDVLVAAHDKGVVHRDLKPDNLFLDKSGQLKVLDFGIARLREGKERPGTSAGSLMGTPSFMPPEQARGRWDDVNARTDLWAVGATMYTLLTGRFVHEAETANEALAFAVTQRAPLLASVMPEVPVGVAAVVDRALCYEMDGRFPDAASMQNAVREAFAGLDDASENKPMPVLSIPPAATSADTVALSSLTPAVDGSTAGARAARAVSATDVGMTRSAPDGPAKKLPGVAIGAGVVLVLLVGIAVVMLVHSHSTSAAAASSAPATSALTEESPKGSAQTVVAPATSKPADDQGAININDLPTAGQKKKRKAGSTHHTTEHSAKKPAPEATAKPQPKVSDDPFAKRR